MPERRATIMDRGVPVTLLCQPLRRALVFTNLCFWEVRDLYVLEDSPGAFEKIRRRFAELAPRIDAAVLKATFEAADYELQAAQTDVELERLRHLRGALHRLAAAWVFRNSKQRVPRLRQFREQLPKDAWAAYQRGMDLRNAERVVRRALRTRASAEVRVDAKEKLDAGRAGDALLILRRHYDLTLADEKYGALVHGEKAPASVERAISDLSDSLQLIRWAPAQTVRLLRAAGLG